MSPRRGASRGRCAHCRAGAAGCHQLPREREHELGRHILASPRRAIVPGGGVAAGFVAHVRMAFPRRVCCNITLVLLSRVERTLPTLRGLRSFSFLSETRHYTDLNFPSIMVVMIH